MRRTIISILFIGCLSVAGLAQKQKIVIVGGGLGGLSTAYYLLQEKAVSGEEITIYEARARLGGRAYTHYWPDGTYAELGGERIRSNGTNKAILSLAKELGVEVDQEPTPHTFLVDQGKLVTAESPLGQELHQLAQVKEEKSGDFRKSTVDKLLEALTPSQEARNLMEGLFEQQYGYPANKMPCSTFHYGLGKSIREMTVWHLDSFNYHDKPPAKLGDYGSYTVTGI